MKLYGLIGFPLHHSFSKGYFTEKFKREKMDDHAYLNFPIENIEKVTDVIGKNIDLQGFNVTIPYKEKIIPFLSEISNDAIAVGAVNTVRVARQRNNIFMFGYNTDVDGFRESLLGLINPDIKHALILGTGGSSKAVIYVLRELGIEYKLVSRKENPEYLHYKDIDNIIMKTHRLIINTTPLGTFPEINTFPDIPYECISEYHILFDLVYNPPETVFLREGKKRGAVIKNGLDMLYRQAEQSWKIWNNPEEYPTVKNKEKVKLSATDIHRKK